MPAQRIEIGDVSPSASDSEENDRNANCGGCYDHVPGPLRVGGGWLEVSTNPHAAPGECATRSFHAMVDDGDSLGLLVHSDELNRHEPYVDFARPDRRSHPHHDTKRGIESGGTFPMGAYVRDPIGEI